MGNPLKTKNCKPLTPHALGVLSDVAVSGSTPTLEANPGVVGRLLRDTLIFVDQQPSPYRANRGKLIPHMRVTDVGRALLKDRGLPYEKKETHS